MPSFKDITEGLIAVWTESTPAARFGLIALSALSVAMLVFVGYWSSQPSFVTLISDSDTEKIAAVVDELAKQGIAFELGGAGGVVKVDQRKLPQAYIAAKKAGISVSGSGSAMGGMDTIWMDKYERQKLATNERARLLEDTIRQYESINDAKVLLNVPVKSAFERAVAKPSASVQLTLAWGRLTEENVMAIAATVASAVENLEPVDVKITDSKGNLYLSDAATSHVNSQTGFVEDRERRLAAKAESQLNRFFGPANASVQISMDYTFLQTNTETIEYDGEGRVANEEDISSSESTTAAANPIGDAGVSANLTNTATGANGTAGNEKTEQLKNKFHVPTTTQTQVNNTPTRNYMTVSVLVNDLATGVKTEDGNLDPSIKQRVEQIVRDAVGFKDDTDTITVDFAPFPEPPELAEAPFDWNYLNDILRNVSLAVAALVVFVLGMMTLRHFKNSQAKALPVDNASAANVNQLGDLARNNPEVLARILKSWVGENPAKAATNDQQKAA